MSMPSKLFARILWPVPSAVIGSLLWAATPNLSAAEQNVKHFTGAVQSVHMEERTVIADDFGIYVPAGASIRSAAGLSIRLQDLRPGQTLRVDLPVVPDGAPPPPRHEAIAIQVLKP